MRHGETTLRSTFKAPEELMTHDSLALGLARVSNEREVLCALQAIWR